MKNHPHDEFFKFLFSLHEVAKAFLNAFLPDELLLHLDLETLAPDDSEHISPELTTLYADKVFTCQLKNSPNPQSKSLVAKIAILLEHKSYAPKFPHFQLNEYRQRIWATSIHKNEKPSIVLPVVLYHGTKSWKKKH